MTSIILASHGQFADGMKQASQMIFGDQPWLYTCHIETGEAPQNLQKKALEIINSLPNDEQILVLCDLFAGSPFNVFQNLFEEYKHRMAIVTGVNLPSLLEASSAAANTKTAGELAKFVLENYQAGVKTIPEIAVEKQTQHLRGVGHTGQKVSSKPIYDSVHHWDIAFIRIDSRLLHGQVAMTWTKAVKPDRIVVVSDSVAKDELRRSFVKQAGPPGVTVNVVPVAKFAEVYPDARFSDTRTFLLFEKPQDLERAIIQTQERFSVKVLPLEINVGTMAHAEGKIMLTKSVSVNSDDIRSVKNMMSMGYNFEVRQVPSDNKQDLMKIIKEKEGK
ncbi:MAG: PTS sugar transporter subunit IIB [Bifidobacteriaceae bacterium]|jgi:PTS system mannose-specific IIB component|nr:PTS sugar transporter subunit IIB [Bifidobacteriaceae bacterium]